MLPPLQSTLESHGRAATLYLHGTLHPHDVVRAFRACYTLPPAVRRLRVDLRAVDATLPAAADTVAILVAAWEQARRGIATVDLPAVLRRAS